jgi:cell division septum initiation protein DivIVA
VLQNPDAKILSKADFLTQREADFLTQRDQAAVPTTAPATAPAPAAAVAPEGQVTTAPDGTKIMPAVQLEDPNLIEPAVAALLATGDPRDKELAQLIEKRLVETRKRQELTGDFQNIVVARKQIEQLKKDPTPTNLAIIKDLEQQIKAANEGKATKVQVGVKLSEQEKGFEGDLGKGQAKRVLEDKDKAEDARDMLSTVSIGRDILKSGAITGAGADFFVGFNQALKTAGIDAGYADASANSQAYSANMAQNVGKLIKLFGAGTGLSDADRAYAEKMAGGKIALDRKALEKILDITERASRNVIKRHNKNVKGIKTNIPLEVELDDEAAPKRNAPAPYSDPDEERRYQEYKAKQKGK